MMIHGRTLPLASMGVCGVPLVMWLFQIQIAPL